MAQHVWESNLDRVISSYVLRFLLPDLPSLDISGLWIKHNPDLTEISRSAQHKISGIPEFCCIGISTFLTIYAKEKSKQKMRMNLRKGFTSIHVILICLHCGFGYFSDSYNS